MTHKSDGLLFEEEVLLVEDQRLAMDDCLFFTDEEAEEELHDQPKSKWKVLIVDDEEEIHNVTKMVLEHFVFDGKGLEIISAYSGQEAKQIILQEEDIALIMLDVVMEHDDAGLKVVKYIREELKNPFVRIILRTGQPGQAPEEKVIMEYDINDYKAKTELTAQKLFTTMVSSLRTYRDIMTIEMNRKGLEKIIEASANIFEMQSMRKFASGVLTQLTSIMNLNRNALYCHTTSGFAAVKSEGEFQILAATGDYYDHVDEKVRDVVPKRVLKDLESAFKEKKSIYYGDHYVFYFRNKNDSENMVYVEGTSELSEWDQDLIEIFCANVSIAFDNIYLNMEIEDTQKEIVFTLGEIAEARSKETGNHVKRVAEYSKLLALKYGLSLEDAEMIRLASPMHDVGKLAIPDAILNKPGRLRADEFEVMKKHAVIGCEMLKNSNRKIMKAATIIANEHHEKYNGKGYPVGKKGEEIHIYGRITAVADVFDALGSDRVYKTAWKLEDILELFRKERGEHFDPILVDILLDYLDEFLVIRDHFADQ